jgi:hypothetical protein
MISFKALRKYVPFEVLPLGVAIFGVTSYAAYRLYSMLRKPEVALRKSNSEGWDWKDGRQ